MPTLKFTGEANMFGNLSDLRKEVHQITDNYPEVIVEEIAVENGFFRKRITFRIIGEPTDLLRITTELLQATQ